MMEHCSARGKEKSLPFSAKWKEPEAKLSRKINTGLHTYREHENTTWVN